MAIWSLWSDPVAKFRQEWSPVVRVWLRLFSSSGTILETVRASKYTGYGHWREREHNCVKYKVYNHYSLRTCRFPQIQSASDAFICLSSSVPCLPFCVHSGQWPPICIRPAIISPAQYSTYTTTCEIGTFLF